MKLTDAQTMRSIDAACMEKYGVAGLQLMENAGAGLARLIMKEMERLCLGTNARVAVIAGKGNNGGDGFVAARHLANRGVKADVYLLSRLDEIKGDAAHNASTWTKMGKETFTVLTEEDLKKYGSALRHSSIIVDGIFGTGLTTDVKGVHAKVIESLNGLGKFTIAIDIPSGINASTGAVLGTAVKAHLTATMALPKLGLYVHPGAGLAGRVEVVDIGAPSELLESNAIRWNLTGAREIDRTLRPRLENTHKGACGHALILAGSPGKTGAAYMSAMGAMRAGAGLVTIGAPEGLGDVIESKTTEVMTEYLPQTPEVTLGEVSWDAIKKILSGKSTVLAGPGMGSSKETAFIVERLIKESNSPVVLDADALNALAGNAEALKSAKVPVVITPHPGEAGRLLGKDAAAVQKDRLGAAEALAAISGATVVLKGAGTIIAGHNKTGKTVYVNPTGNAGLATAGTGDVLAGIITGLVAQGYNPMDAAFCGVYIHGLAADNVKERLGETGMMATDLLPEVPLIINSFTQPGR